MLLMWLMIADATGAVVAATAFIDVASASSSFYVASCF